MKEVSRRLTRRRNSGGTPPDAGGQTANPPTLRLALAAGVCANEHTRGQLGLLV